MANRLTLSNGNVLDISPDHDARISSVRALSYTDGLHIVTKTRTGRIGLAGELLAWGAKVETVDARILRVSA
jgi:hypothetical protein